MATIALCMIVKNEAHVIRRCLESALPLIDYVLIVDTGSSDGTQQVVREFLQDKALSGQVIDEPWRDFAYNRSFALRMLRECPHIAYGLMIDADNVIEYGVGFDAHEFKQDLRQDLYDVNVRLADISYSLPLLFSNRVGFVYKGVLHEYLVVPPNCTRATALGFSNRHHPDGARSRNPRKYQDDAAVLDKALLTETDPFLIARYTFYLAQSYRDYGENERAVQCYLRRAQLGFWKEEVFISLYRAARIMEALGRSDAEILQTYLDAYEAFPTRAESLHGAIRYCRLHRKYQQGYILGQHALALVRPETGLFLEEWIYAYGLLDEYAIVAYWAGHYRECFDACLRILGEKAIPEPQRDRVRKNAEYSIAKLDDPKLAGMLDSV
ncbi:MAG: glycosyltransferase [Gammaproteobacteria bacterium]